MNKEIKSSLSRAQSICMLLCKKEERWFLWEEPKQEGVVVKQRQKRVTHGFRTASRNVVEGSAPARMRRPAFSIISFPLMDS